MGEPEGEEKRWLPGPSPASEALACLLAVLSALSPAHLHFTANDSQGQEALSFRVTAVPAHTATPLNNRYRAARPLISVVYFIGTISQKLSAASL